MAFPTHDPLCSDFYKALGLDPNATRKIVLTMEPNHVVTFEAQIYAERDGIKDVGEIITKRCKIVPIGEPEMVIGSQYIKFPKEEG
jgi:hypothetical protein